MKIATQLRWLFIMSLFPTFLFSQQAALKFKLQLMPDGERWGVYVKPDDSVSLGEFMYTSTAQVTIVAPLNYGLSDLTNISGNWQSLLPINGPSINPTSSFYFFGLVTDFPHILYQSGHETLLFTFKGQSGCPENLRFINDVEIAESSFPQCDFCAYTGNEISAINMVTSEIYEYAGNYAPAAWDCHDNDGDGLLNAHEDTNGNGQYDPNEDASDLNEYDGIVINDDIRYKLQLMPDGEFWGVFAKADEDSDISTNTITGTGQITIVMPKDFHFTNFTNVSGTWSGGSGIHGPSFAPDKSFWSFGLQSNFPSIVYEAGKETLLFKFKKQDDCPSDLHLFDNSEVLPPDFPYNLTNEITIFDPATQGIYGYGSNYAQMAWDCHDNDGDGLANAIEDTNGNGVFDPGVDASDLGSAPLPGCVKLNLQILPDQSGWAVVAKPITGFAPSATTSLEAGRVTIITSKDFEFGGFQTGSSPWEATTVLAPMPNNPNRKYITFELAGNSAPLSLIPGQETMLFKFDKLGDCPKSLAILENTTAAGPIPNELSGTTSYGLQENSFDLCGFYDRKAWKCKGQSTPPIIVVVAPDSLGTPPATDRDADFTEGNIAEGKQWFTASPNPAGDFVNITVSAHLAEGRTSLALWDVQGKKRQEIQVENATTQLDLSGLPAGVYLVSLAQNGRVVQREKLIKH